MSELADSHVHLDWYEDPFSLIERARLAGVGVLVGMSVDGTSARRTIEIAHRSRGVIAAAGFHPAYLPEHFGSSEIADLANLASDLSVGCIGEIGIDTVDSRIPLERQIVAFREQLVVASRLGLPVNLHVRGDFNAALDVLALDGVSAGGIVHYFVGDEALAARYLALGLVISVAKPVTRPGNGPLSLAARRIPLDRLVLETDSYPLPGRSTEPADVVRIARAVAELRGMTTDEIAGVTTGNLRRLLPARVWEWAQRADRS